MNDLQPPRVAVLIVGAGQGSRAYDETDGIPKQFYPIAGKTLFQWTVDAFCSVPQVLQITCVVPEGTEPGRLPTISAGESSVGFSTVDGGSSRQMSVLYGLQHLKAMSDEWDVVLVHDAARPFVSTQIIQSVITLAARHGGCIAAVPVVDSLKQADRSEIADETVIRISGALDRDGVYQAQTPQGFHFNKLLNAHTKAHDDGERNFSDDSIVYETYCGPVVIANGDRNNWKVTEPDDFKTARLLMNTRQETVSMPDVRVGHGYDVHAFEEGSEVILCGVALPHERALKGHSDADVGLHALTDAVLAGLADGDIGAHFPPNDPKWKAASSDQFLAFAVDLASQRMARITHLDVTLVCEAPKIGPHREAMRSRVSEITGIDRDRISVKATTSERLGFTGRKEGISAFATATLVFPVS